MALEVGHSPVQEVSLSKAFLPNRCVEGYVFLLSHDDACIISVGSAGGKQDRSCL